MAGHRERRATIGYQACAGREGVGSGQLIGPALAGSSRVQLAVILILVSLCQETRGLVKVDGKWVYCATYPELYGPATSGRIKGGIDMIHPVPKLPCPDREAEESRFRTYDGSCNAHDDQGATFSVLKRLMAPWYEGDDFDQPRRTDKFGSPLPSARLVSRTVHRASKKRSRFTHLLMQIGQLADHDYTAVPIPTETDSTIVCCNVPEASLHKECFPIDVDKKDPHFKDCMEFARSEPVHLENGTQVYPRLHHNVITSFMDGSFIYGSDRHEAEHLRDDDGHGALMRVSKFNGKDRLPMGEDDTCINEITVDHCPVCGDHRCGEQPALTAIHWVYVMEHNRQVRRLVRALLFDKHGQTKYPNYKIPEEDVEDFIYNTDNTTKELLFQVVRKIVIGAWQHMQYREYIPLIVGRRFMYKYSLAPRRYPNERIPFTSKLNPSMTEEFSAAAYRFGHSLIPDDFFMGSDKHALKTLFGVSKHALDHSEKIIRGLILAQRSDKFDEDFADSILDHLFENVEENNEGESVKDIGAIKNTDAKKDMKPLGFDLIALNIQRGRDHGIATYNQMRSFFGRRPYTTFSQFRSCGRNLAKVYKHPDDVDLFVGGVCEKPVPGGVVGETFADIIGRQMYELKYGDRYFYETDSHFFGFTDAQLASIKQQRIAKVLCETAEMEYIQWNPYFPPRYYRNPPVHCSRLRDIDMVPFLSYFNQDTIKWST